MGQGTGNNPSSTLVFDGLIEAPHRRAGSEGRIVTHAGYISILPNNRSSNVQKILQINHRRHRIEEEADEVRESRIRNAVRRPWTVMIHLWDTSSIPIEFQYQNGDLHADSRTPQPLGIDQRILTAGRFYNGENVAVSRPHTVDTIVADALRVECSHHPQSLPLSPHHSQLRLASNPSAHGLDQLYKPGRNISINSIATY